MAGEAGLRLRSIRTKRADTTGGSDYGDGEQREPVTPAGRMFNQPIFDCYVICIVGFKNMIDIPTIKTGLQQTFVQHKRFSSIMEKDKHGSEYWVRTEVNLDDHIVVPLASAMNLESDRRIEKYAAGLGLAPPLDRSRPLWEVHVLNFESADAAASLILRLHHSLGDGISLMSLFLASTRSVANPDSLPSVRPGLNSNQKKAESMKGYIFLFWRMLIVIWCTLIEVGKFFLLLLGVKDSQTPLKGFSGVEHSPKSLYTGSIRMDDMRIVKNAVGGTVNDVFLGIISAGIRRYLEQHADEVSVHPSENQGKVSGQQKCTDFLRIRATVLVNTRPKAGLQELASMMKGGSQARWGNNVGYVIIPMCVKHFDDPLDYIRKAKEVSDRKKYSLEAPFSYASGQLVMKLFGAKAAANLTYRSVLHTTLSISNMIGPLEEVMFMGNPITYIVPTSYGQAQSLCIHLQTYMGKAKLVVTVAKDIIPDPDVLLQHILDALKDMKQAACARGH
ncbi:hypothetical protein O6H91_01G027800 [Diphasiastrum complanatum]|uniref:Uncharacterized protein n=1 Tax=Diphasiastrum complanatum TaxID=34168 RepID=A0ACC2EPA8_DIPCM|nr:hypothetical protein O6H91_01G027800 [Diphasiastrum complanatum]